MESSFRPNIEGPVNSQRPPAIADNERTTCSRCRCQRLNLSLTSINQRLTFPQQLSDLLFLLSGPALGRCAFGPDVETLLRTFCLRLKMLIFNAHLHTPVQCRTVCYKVVESGRFAMVSKSISTEARRPLLSAIDAPHKFTNLEDYYLIPLEPYNHTAEINA